MAPEPLNRDEPPASGVLPSVEALVARITQLEQQLQQDRLQREWLLALINSLPDDMKYQLPAAMSRW